MPSSAARRADAPLIERLRKRLQGVRPGVTNGKHDREKISHELIRAGDLDVSTDRARLSNISTVS
jgi:hypothetical protein